MAIVKDNRDTGSLKVGTGEFQIGDKIQVVGEAAPRTISFVMGKHDKGTLCILTNGFPAFPIGDVEYSKVSE